MCESIEQFMDYHVENRSGDGFHQILVDGYAFREIEEKYHILKLKLIMLGFHWC